MVDTNPIIGNGMPQIDPPEVPTNPLTFLPLKSLYYSRPDLQRF